MELHRTGTNAQLTDETLAVARLKVIERLLERDGDRFGGDDYIDFSVERTNDRKGYRDPRPFDNTSPYQGDPKVRVTIEIELDDDDLGLEIVELIKRLEREQRG